MSQKVRGFLGLLDVILGTSRVINKSINPLAPEPPVTACADPGPFYPLWRHQF